MLALMSVDYACTYLKQTQLATGYCASRISTVCEQSALVCHGQQLPCVS